MALKLAVYGYDTDIGKLVIETLEEQHLPLDDFFHYLHYPANMMP